jgi:hypothetical protein
MPLNNSTSIGMIAAGTQAPSVNLDTTTTRATTPVATAPTALITRLDRQRGSFIRRWCTTMPDCESVKPVKTPTA